MTGRMEEGRGTDAYQDKEIPMIETIETPTLCACGCGDVLTKALMSNTTFRPGHDQKALWALFRLLFPGQSLDEVCSRLGVHGRRS